MERSVAKPSKSMRAGWSVYQLHATLSHYVRITGGFKFQAACRLYDKFREAKPEVTFSINYFHGRA